MTEKIIPQIISREQAKSLGLKRFFTGAPCKREHIAERSIVDGYCISCMKISAYASQKRNKKKRNETRQKLRKRKRALGQDKELEYSRRLDIKKKSSAYSLQWQKDNRERKNSTRQAWRKRNRESGKDRELERRRHPEIKKKSNANSSLWQKQNKERRNFTRKAWRERRKLEGKDKELQRKRLPEIKERNRVYNIEWAKKNPEKKANSWRNRRARVLSAEGKHTAEDVRKIIEQQNFLCIGCYRKVALKFSVDALKAHVDHIHPISKGGVNWPSNLQILCWRCNLSKGNKTMQEWLNIKIM